MHQTSDVSPSPNSREGLVHECIHRHGLYAYSKSCYASGPKYTFFSGRVNTTIDYILIESSVASQVVSCRVHEYHPLNLSDHLPISMVFRAETKLPSHTETTTDPINWALAIQRGDTSAYSQEVSSIVSPFLSTSHHNVEDLHWEIAHVCHCISEAATRLLPHKKHKKRKLFVKDKQLKALCKASKEAWVKWRDAGKPLHGPLADNKKTSKNEVCKFVALARAKQERLRIQKCDQMFKENHTQRFKTSRQRSAECSKLVVDGKPVTDMHDILHEFKSFYGSLASSNIEHSYQLSYLEERTYGSSEKLLDTEICVEEIEAAMKAIKLGKSGGPDGLSPEHLVYGGKALKIWLKKIFNCIIVPFKWWSRVS